jgi:hypothetical protein
MFVLLTLSLIGFAAAQCPQDAFNVRNEFQRGTNQDGMDLTFWYHRGRTFVGQSSNAAFGGVLNVGESFSSSSAFGTATLEDLEANGEEWFFALGHVALAGPVVGEECVLTVGSAPKFCIKRNARWEFTNQFGLLPQAAPSADATVAFTARRFVSNGSIRITYEARNRGTGIIRANGNQPTGLPAVVWDFSQGFTFNAPLTGQTTTITQFMVLHGRGDQSAAATAFLTAAPGNSNAFQSCLFQEWLSGTSGAKPYAVPSVNANNLVATFRRTNFQTTPVAAATAAAVWDPELTEISNVTSIVGSTGVVVAPMVGTTAQVSFPQLEPGASQQVAFTAQVFNCTPSGFPRTAPAGEEISVGGVDADLHILRESRLTFTVIDKRPFDLVDLPIAAGCDVPFVYTIDVTNEGPSCVENLDIGHTIETALDANGGDASSFVAPNITADLILPGAVRDGEPVEVTITATAAAGNEQFLNRSLQLVSPLDGGVFSASMPQPHYFFFRRTRIDDEPNLNVLSQTYEIARYGDMQIQYLWEDETVVAGEFGDSSSPNLRGTLTVKNAGCVTAIDVEIVLKIEQPPGSWYFDNTGEGATNAAQRLPLITRHVKIGTLSAGEVRSLTLEFAVCQHTKASTAALNVNAFVLRSGDSAFEGELEKFETTAPTTEPTKFTRLVPVNRFDDKTQDSATITLEALLDAKLECAAPVLISTDNFEHEDSDDDGVTSDTVHDIDLRKLTRCKVTVRNAGSSDVPVKVKLDWALPEGTRFVRWSGPNDNNNQFVADGAGGVWAVAAKSNSGGPTFNKCKPRTGGEAQVLELDFASTKHGTIQIVARVDKQASVAAISGTLGNAHTIQI